MVTSKASVPLDDLLPKLGSPGKYQVIMFFLLACNYYPVCFNHVIMAFYGSTPPHTCVSDVIESTQTNVSIIKKEAAKCVTSYHLSDGQNTTFSCKQDTDKSWKYKPYSSRETSIITEWNLVCDEAYLGKLATTIYFCGVMVGGFIFGHLADFVGRKPIMLVCLYVPVGLGVGIYFVETLAVFITLRFFQGVFIQGLQTSTVSLVMELARKEYRGLAIAAFECVWGTGVLVLAGICYFVQTWRYIQLVISLPSALAFWYFWVVPESPRWLIMNKKFDKADTLVKKVTSFNNLPYPADVMESVKEHGLKTTVDRKYTLLDLLKTSVLRSRTFLLYFMWFSTSMGYYGLTFQITSLAGDKYLNFFIGAMVEMVAYVAVIYVIKRFGRRRPLTTYFLIGGLACILAGCIPFAGSSDELSKVSTSFAIIGRFGMGGVFSVIVLYTSELYPTVVRNIGLGSCFFWTRVGGLIAPQVILLGDIIHKSFPVITIGVFAVAGGLMTLVLPETLGKKLPDTIQDAENLKGTKLIREKSDKKSSNSNGKTFDTLEEKEPQVTRF